MGMDVNHFSAESPKKRIIMQIDCGVIGGHCPAATLQTCFFSYIMEPFICRQRVFNSCINDALSESVTFQCVADFFMSNFSIFCVVRCCTSQHFVVQCKYETKL